MAVAFALGGRAGARLLDVLALPCGRMSLPRAIRATPEAAPPTPRVLGIDDFALRRGHVYATILVNVATGRPVDVLPDRTKQTVARLAIHTRERYATIQELVRRGVSCSAISRQLHLDPHTVRRFAGASTVEELLANTRRDSLVDPYRPYLHQRWNEGCTDASILHAEIRARACCRRSRNHLAINPLQVGNCVSAGTLANRSTSSRIERTVRGRPSRFGRDRTA